MAVLLFDTGWAGVKNHGYHSHPGTVREFLSHRNCIRGVLLSSHGRLAPPLSRFYDIEYVLDLCEAYG
ncbi:hypothetical protein JZ751_014891 [Albula glossodonta]|uniref:Uncharacterized protein n=1 Tax=Albula glossodonta TaxID=121402 RepID=A0A8T2N527_9TELE|nr:hypothetical protein JZ751_014891 [Albula glossodonta]